MKEFVFSYIHGNYYLSNFKSNGAFDGETQVRLVIKPHDFEMRISDDVLRRSSCNGYTAELTNKGAVTLFDTDGNLLAQSENTDKEFSEFSVDWKEGLLTLRFGHMETVDNYPNCDGEHDRWDTVWVADHEVKFNITTNQFV